MNILQKAEKFAKKEYLSNDPKHQWSHIQAVLNRAMEIIKNFKNIDLESLKLAIIFHDIDYTAYDTHVDDSVKIAEKFLIENNHPKNKIEKIKEIMLDHSTPHRKERGEATLIEGKIIYDADKSIGMNDLKFREKYFPKLYLDETKDLVQKTK